MLKQSKVKRATSLLSGRVETGERVVIHKITERRSTLSTKESSLASSAADDDDFMRYDYDPKTGLPIFDIDDCSDNELLGGEPAFAPREIEVESVHEIRRRLTGNEKVELTDPRMIIRHFRAEKGNIEKAVQTLREALKWRREFELTALRVCMSNHSDKATGHKDYGEMMKLENATGKIFVRGKTLEGRALQYMFAMRNNTNSDIDNMRHLAWNLEKSIRVTQHNNPSLDKYCLLIDCGNFDLRKAPSLHASKMTLDLLQKHFKERMHRIYVLNPPLPFRMFWKLVKPFIDPVTKTKIVFCSGPTSEGARQLCRDVGVKQANRLEKCAFGTDSIRPFDSKEYLNLPMHIGFDDS